MTDILKTAGGVLGGIANLVSGGALLDAAGDALGLPPVITQAVKTVAGAMTGNVVLAMDGAMGLTQELGKNPPAATEYCPCRDDTRAGEGYARPERTPRGGSPPGTGGGVVDPKLKDYLGSLRTLERNFTYLDATDGRMDGALRLLDLQRISGDGRVSPELRGAARFLVDNPGYFKRLDVSAGASRARDDEAFDLNDLRGEIGTVKAELAAGPGGTAGGPRCGTSPAQNPSNAGGASSSVKGIINDPGMSLEEKINAILSNLTEKMDDEILQTMDGLAAAQDKKAGISSAAGNEKSLTEAQRDIDRLSMRLQQLVEKRKTMFEMMSTMSMKFNEMAKTALSNMRSA